MGLKDVSKINANEKARQDARNDSIDAAVSRRTPEARDEDIRIDQLSRTVKPFTHTPAKPEDFAGHKGFKYDSGNPFHKDILKTLRDTGNLGKLSIHEGGVASMPNDVAYGMGGKFQTAADFAQGGEISFTKPSDSVRPAPRKSEKDSKTPGKRPGKTVLETVGDALAAGAAPLNVDQIRAQKRREMEARQEKINENIRRRREGKK